MDVLVDTNVILRRLQRSLPQHRKAREAIAKFSKDGHRICVTSQNLVELWAVCTRPIENNGFGLTPAQARLSEFSLGLKAPFSDFPNLTRSTGSGAGSL